MKYTGYRQDYINEHIHNRLVLLENPVDYQAKYEELEAKYRIIRTTIKESLVALYPWYSHGKVGNPMDAVEALKSIDKAVNS